jgi:hypothetical protein
VRAQGAEQGAVALIRIELDRLVPVEVVNGDCDLGAIFGSREDRTALNGATHSQS